MLSHRFDDALTFATSAHLTQRRKGCDIPYISHLMAVCALVLEYGGDEDCAIAALLHDAVEDQGGRMMADQIKARFGSRVCDIVLACSDREDETETDWRMRKQRYLDQIDGKSDDAILVTTCDKLHNATTILYDVTAHGPAVFDRFTAKKKGTLWYYTALAQTLSKRNPSSLSNRLTETVDRLQKIGCQ